jgi:terminase small subunit-like protein
LSRRATINIRELAFVEKYVETMRAKDSAEYAGYRHAERMGYKLLRRPVVQAAIEARRQQISAELNVTPSEVIRRMMLIGYSDPADILDEDGQLLALRAMPKDARLALSSVKILKTEVEVRKFPEDGEPEVTMTTTYQLIECKFWDKPKMLNSLAEHLNLFGTGGGKKHPWEDMTIEELDRATAANEAALAAIEGASASSRKALMKAVAKSTAATMAETAPPKPVSGGKGVKKSNRKDSAPRDPN